MSKKRDRRIAKGAREHEEAVAEHAAQSALAAKQDSDLFVLDTAGAQRASKRQKTFVEVVVASNTVSKTEQVLLGRKMALRADTAEIPEKEQPLRDLWEGDVGWVPVVANKKRAVSTTNKPAAGGKKKSKAAAASAAAAAAEEKLEAARVTRKLRAPRSGQSYNPSTDDHQEAVTSALALEMKRAEKEAKLLALSDLRNNSSTELVGTEPHSDSSDDGEANSDEEGTNGNEDSGNKTKVGSGRSKKQGVKATRAQRNKQRARNISKFEEDLRRAEKLKGKQANNVAALAKEIRMKEEQIKMTKAEVKEKKQATLEENLYAMTYAEAGTVPLSDELSGSLRQIIPKGIPLVDRENVMRKHGDLAQRDRRNRRAYEKPHASEKVVWVPKYKVHEFQK